jgi:deoxyribonuclease-4
VHVSVAGGLATAFDRAAALGCGTIQIFVKNANRWRAPPLAASEVTAFRAAHRAFRRGAGPAGHAATTARPPALPMFAHASYLINLAADDEGILAQSRQALADEIERCAALGIAALVVHPGAHLGAGEEAGLDRAAAALDSVLAGLPGVRTRVLLENTAGQGSCLGHRLEHLAGIRSRLPAARRRRVGICIDTCHAFAAGHPIHEAAGWRDFLAELAGRLGLATLGCIHLNDSLRPFGSRRDRHAHIGEGEIGTAAFARVLAEPALASVPMIVETDPGKDMAGHRRDLEVLRGLTSRGGSRAGGSSTGRTRSRRPSASG